MPAAMDPAAIPTGVKPIAVRPNDTTAVTTDPMKREIRLPMVMSASILVVVAAETF